MKILAAFLVTATVALHAQTADVSGDWQGSLKAGAAELRIVLHIAKASDGALSATFDSIDQGANGIPIGPVTVAGNQITFASAAIGAKYEGKVSADGSAIDGNWTQGQPIPLVFKRAAKTTRKPGTPSDIDGAWLGTIDLGGTKLRIVFHIVNMEDGLFATADSPDQGAKGMPVTAVTRMGDKLKLEMKAIGAGFEGTIAKDRSSIEGTFSQGGGEFPLVLKPMKDAATLDRKRPQNPAKPYPYREEEVTFKNDSASITLAATLTIPEGKGPFPAVVLITGSGPQDRDETLLGHKPFLVLADHLTRKGIAVLRADDRGVAKSGGDFAKATSADFATDAEAGLAYLKTRGDRRAQAGLDRAQRRRVDRADGGGSQLVGRVHRDDGGAGCERG